MDVARDVEVTHSSEMKTKIVGFPGYNFDNEKSMYEVVIL